MYFLSAEAPEHQPEEAEMQYIDDIVVTLAG